MPLPAGTGQHGAVTGHRKTGRFSRLRGLAARHERKLWLSLALLLAAAVWWAPGRGQPAPAPTLEQLEKQLRQSLLEKPLPSQASVAAATVRGSVVRVMGMADENDDGSSPADGEPRKDDGAKDNNGKDSSNPPPGSKNPGPTEKQAGKTPAKAPGGRGIGTGVVIVDNGTILTNLHVVQGARRIRVTFADGHESDATVINVQPENDLAVLRARSVPDDLQAATLRSTGDLLPGDEVVAVGFPFGIGPSVSSGVVSGLKREFRSPDGQQMLSNLIQFDAAANPGNSGGPLVTMDGAVVGIVTAIFNPVQQRFFVGIGFAVPIENAAAAAGMPPF